jgi:hypothetical protein
MDNDGQIMDTHAGKNNGTMMENDGAMMDE